MRQCAAAATEVDEWLTPSETSSLTKLSVNTLKDMRWRKAGPPYTKLSPGRGGRIRYRRAHVVAWLNRDESKSAA